jgi:hypothetical protein
MLYEIVRNQPAKLANDHFDIVLSEVVDAGDIGIRGLFMR